ncbi:flavin reductase family protein [Marinobacter sp. 1_MG-2023]|uniref:flavin reductase family protein n=1 Tax=Marinobacter sp. 1_MG-2023 TaxID=3062627 RepID=UPI0026E26076|nr:flavin reductase family protein [Marinobacter sp. 1_MG-2023]MDO6822989.1 flavin reductase family protein [Marinobacter sp. 1_MG-2023]
MAEGIHFYEPAQGHGLAHDPFNALVAPRPIGWISSRSSEGTLNLAPYSFFNAFNYIPPIIGFSSIGYKDSVRNAQETGEFCWNLVTRSLSDAMNQTCAPVGPEVDEFALAGLTPRPSRIISPPHVAESPVTLECTVSQVLQLSGADGKKVDTWVVFGEVVGVHIAQQLLKDGIYDTAAAEPVMRGGGPADYFTLDAAQKFQMHRPK